MLSYDELTPPERELWDAFPEGRHVDLRTGTPGEDRVTEGGQWGPERTVRATVIAVLLSGGNAPRPGAAPGLRLAGARISGHLDLSDLELGQALRIEECWFEEAPTLQGASTRTIRIMDSRLPGLDAGLARVEGHLDLSRSRVEGCLNLLNASVAGELVLNGTRVCVAKGWAVIADGLDMGGGIFCMHGFTARGGIRLLGAQLPGGLFMQRAHVESPVPLGRPGPRGVALALDNVVASTLNLSDGFTSDGTVRLRGARVSDTLTFAGAVLNAAPGGDGTALAGPLMQVTDFDVTCAQSPSGTVDLRGAQVSRLRDNEHSWPETVELDGFVYGSVETLEAVEATEAGERREVRRRRQSVAYRVGWIRRSPGYSPQPYEQLASWYRTTGHDDDARRVLLAKQRHRRRTLRPAAQVWGHVLDMTVGYGYRPWLAGIWLLALTLLGNLAFRTQPPTPVKEGEGAPFQPLVYTLDLLIPIGGLGQRTAWYWSNGSLQWLAHLLIAFGWVLTTAVIAGATRALQKD
ncbi:oxidoreductase [Streptomyces longispororuber]|uniref:oxidoreductase n=1 Tax=Streptomyces longispororuber TaxID=68230 RepID=UPI00210F0E18|nr:oxidoreductase [Streptomyces longispororuber]MCQ4206606.1 oxidoreductase [Streptomyces longispororuber]